MVKTLSKEKRVEFYKEQIELEELIIEKAKLATDDIKNPLVKQMILGISLDSKKHKMLLSALIAKHTSSTPFLEESATKQLKENLEEHIKLEQKAIDTYKELLGKIEDEGEKMIINAIYKDELTHHSLLKKLHKMVVESETFTEEDMFEAYWKDSLFHGSPGG